jgi:pyridoxamine 5'-phosphate oxidase
VNGDETSMDAAAPGAAGQEDADFTLARDPFALFDAWFQEAVKSEPNDPNGMALATVDASGLPSVRMVLLKGVDAADVPGRGFLFYTNSESAKGRELAANPQAGLLFHWKSLRRQVRVRGSVLQVSGEEADAYFATRARLSRIGAWASDQSRPLESRFALEKRVALLTAKFGISEVPRPPHWTGFRVTPLEIEFWQDKPFRLHDRLVFRRDDAAAQWTITRLYP